MKTTTLNLRRRLRTREARHAALLEQEWQEAEREAARLAQLDAERAKRTEQVLAALTVTSRWKHAGPIIAGVVFLICVTWYALALTVGAGDWLTETLGVLALAASPFAVALILAGTEPSTRDPGDELVARVGRLSSGLVDLIVTNATSSVRVGPSVDAAHERNVELVCAVEHLQERAVQLANDTPAGAVSRVVRAAYRREVPIPFWHRRVFMR